jgi:hypothetical protein
MIAVSANVLIYASKFEPYELTFLDFVPRGKKMTDVKQFF